jgi:hypothetical protein
MIRGCTGDCCKGKYQGKPVVLEGIGGELKRWLHQHGVEPWLQLDSLLNRAIVQTVSLNSTYRSGCCLSCRSQGPQWDFKAACLHMPLTLLLTLELCTLQCAHHITLIRIRFKQKQSACCVWLPRALTGQGRGSCLHPHPATCQESCFCRPSRR